MSSDKPRIFTDEQLVQFWDWFNEHWQDAEWFIPAFYVAIILTHGFRRMEAARIAINDITLGPRCRVHIPMAKMGKPRTVDTLPQFIPHLTRRTRQCQDMNWKLLFHGTRTKDPKTGRTTRVPVDPSTARAWWNKVWGELGIPTTGCHQGRRTFATHVLKIPFFDNNGIPRYIQLADLKLMMGHSNYEITGQYYIEPIPGTVYPRADYKALEWPDHVCPETNKED